METIIWSKVKIGEFLFCPMLPTLQRPLPLLLLLLLQRLFWPPRLTTTTLLTLLLQGLIRPPRRHRPRHSCRHKSMMMSRSSFEKKKAAKKAAFSPPFPWPARIFLGNRSLLGSGSTLRSSCPHFHSSSSPSSSPNEPQNDRLRRKRGGDGWVRGERTHFSSLTLTSVVSRRGKKISPNIDGKVANTTVVLL